MSPSERKRYTALIKEMMQLWREMKKCDGCSAGKDECDVKHDAKVEELMKRAKKLLEAN